MSLKFWELLCYPLADVVAPKRRSGEADVFYDPVCGATGFTHTVSAAGRYQDIIPCRDEAWFRDDLSAGRVRRLSHHHFAGVNMFHQLRRKAVDWYADHFLARDMAVREIGNGKHYAHSHLIVPMGCSRRRAAREAIKELNRIHGEERLFYVERRPAAARRKL